MRPLYRPSLVYEVEQDEDQATDIDYLEPFHLLCDSLSSKLRTPTIHTRQASSTVPTAMTIFLRPVVLSLCRGNTPNPHTSIGEVRRGICNPVHVLQFDIPIAGYHTASFQIHREITAENSFFKRLFQSRLFNRRQSHRRLYHRGLPHKRLSIWTLFNCKRSVTGHAMEYSSQY